MVVTFLLSIHHQNDLDDISCKPDVGSCQEADPQNSAIRYHGVAAVAWSRPVEPPAKEKLHGQVKGPLHSGQTVTYILVSGISNVDGCFDPGDVFATHIKVDTHSLTAISGDTHTAGTCP